MRLLNIHKFEFVDFLNDNKPPYVAASHRWLRGGETTFQDVRDRRNANSEGYRKVQAFAEYIANNIPHIEWLWIDTCCINKESAAELSEAINSMFGWYRDAKLCLAYLTDVQTGSGVGGFKKSEWFRRGWTLQELLAPRVVVFVNKTWQVIGHKGQSSFNVCRTFIGADLGPSIAEITGIPKQVLDDYNTSGSFTVADKIGWMQGRQTTLAEDMSYALFGILSVTLPVIYGEGHKGAKQRLLDVIYQRENLAVQQAEYYRKITDWLSSPDPWTNHESARQRHEPGTGDWLLRATKYLEWKSGSIRLLWLYGKAGCGKTILSSTTIQDMKEQCQNATNIGHAIFYFSFTDTHKQTFENLIRSLVTQLCRKEPGVSMLRQAYEKTERRLPGPDELRKILLASIKSYDMVYVHIDAIDECPEADGVRQKVTYGLVQLMEQAPNLRIIATSRDVPDVRSIMEDSNADLMPLLNHAVDADIRRYVTAEVARDHRLCRLDATTKTMIEATLTVKADGMYVT